jgi:hypothetical protein
MPGQTSARMLCNDLDEAVAALASFDLDRLDAIEHKIRATSTQHLVDVPKLLPELLAKHALLGQLLTVTETNLKVLVSVLHLESRMETRPRWVL